MNSFFTNDKKFLEKYKDIILTKKIPDEGNTYTNLPYYEDGIKNITGHTMKKLVISNIISKSEREIQNDLLDGYDGSVTFTEYTKAYFLNNNNKKSPRDVKPSDLNMAEIYGFCVQAPAALKKIETDFNSFYSEAGPLNTRPDSYSFL